MAIAYSYIVDQTLFLIFNGNWNLCNTMVTIIMFKVVFLCVFLCDMLEVLKIEKKGHVVRIAIAHWEYFSIRIWSNKGSLHIKQL